MNALSTPITLSKKLAQYKHIASICALLLLGVSAAEAKGAAKAPGADKALSAICPAGNSGKKASKADKQRATLLKRLQAIAQGGDINAADKKGQTALMFAAALDNRPAVCWLVAKGADVNLKTASGKTAADYAKHPRILDLLKACAYDQNPPVPGTDWGRTSYGYGNYEDPGDLAKTRIHWTERDGGQVIVTVRKYLEIALHFMDTKALMKQLDQEGLAIERCSAECVAYLVRRGYKLPEIPESLLAQATPEKVQLLCVLGAKFQPAGMKYVAAACDDIPMMKKLIKESPQLRQSEEMLVRAQSAEMARLFLPDGQRPDLFNLMNIEGHPATMSKSAAAFLISQTGADVNAVDSKDGTPLLCTAIYRNCNGIAQALIEAGADTSKGKDTTALLIAIEDMCPDSEIIEALIKAGADVNAKNSRGRTVLQRAIADYDNPSIGRTVRLLLEAGAKAPKDILLGYNDIQYIMRRLPEAEALSLFELLVKNGADINAKKDNLSALNCVGFLHLSIAKRMVEAGCTADMQDALHSAISNGRADVAEYLLSKGAKINDSHYTLSDGSKEDMVKLEQLLKKYGVNLIDLIIEPGSTYCDVNSIGRAVSIGCDINAQDNEGRTMLHHAVREFEYAHSIDRQLYIYDAIGILLKAGAKTDIRDKEGKTVLMYVKEKAKSEYGKPYAYELKILEHYGVKE